MLDHKLYMVHPCVRVGLRRTTVNRKFTMVGLARPMPKFDDSW